MVGVIDSDYRGEIIITLHNDTDDIQFISPNERIAQLVIIPYVSSDFIDVDKLSETERGNKGFGSTGRKYKYKILKQSDLYNILPFGKTKINKLLKSGQLPLLKIGNDYITTFNI